MLLFLLFFSWAASAQDPFGSPGLTPSWSSAKKVHLGTSYEVGTSLSPVWFTAAEGILTEVYYPRIDRAQMRDSQILITDGDTFFAEEKTDLEHQVQWHSPQLVTLKNLDPKGRFSLSHTFFTSTQAPVLIDEIEIEANVPSLKFYLLVNPALNNSGLKDHGSFAQNQFIFSQTGVQLRVSSTCALKKGSIGFEGFSDGFQDLQRDLSMDYHYPKAGPGNIAAMAQLDLPAAPGKYLCHVFYDFSAHKKGNWAVQAEKKQYLEAWQNYFDSLIIPQGISDDFKNLYLRSFFVLKSFEDKSHPGAFVASLSIPWGEEVRVQDSFTGGYHLVWPRDLYNIALGFFLGGDRASALRALEFLKKIQYRKGEWNYDQRLIPKLGAFPQNVWVDGKDYWSGFQVDQVGYGVLLFAHLYESASSKEKIALLKDYELFLTASLDFIKYQGPWTAQERWEENFGISPSSFSIVTAALLYGDKLFPRKQYAKIAQGWLTKEDDNIHTWTFTRNGHYDDGNYFVRISGCANFMAPWNPNDGSKCHVANTQTSTRDVLRVEQTRLLDQGFLLLSLLGLVPADHSNILTSWDKVNDHLKIQTPKGPAWHRYTLDAYGENQQGQLWPIFGGEQGRYYWELYHAGRVTEDEAQEKSDELLQAFFNFSNQGLMIPEQIFEKSGLGTGSATPLAWSHAEYIKLLWSSAEKRNVEKLSL